MLLHFVLLLLLSHTTTIAPILPPHTHAFLQTCDTTGLIVHRDGKLDRRNEQSRTQKGQPKAHTKICRYTSYRVSPRVKNSVPRSTYNRNLLVPRKKSIFPRSLTCIWQLSSNRNISSSRPSNRSGKYRQAMGGL